MQLTKWVHEPIWISKVKVIPWTKVTQIQHFQTSFPEKPLSRLKPDFMLIFHGMGERKFVQMVQVTWPRWPLCPYMVKILLLCNPKADDLDSWYAASGIGYLSTTKYVQMMTLGWPWPILWQGQILSLMLSYGKKVKQRIFQKLL